MRGVPLIGRRRYSRGGTAALVLASGALAACGTSGPVGDQGGHMLSQLRSIGGAIPHSATAVGPIKFHEPVFTGHCTSTMPNVQVVQLFRSSQKLGTLHAEVATWMSGHGWGHPTASGPGRWYTNGVLSDNYVYRWSKRLNNRATATAALQTGVPVTGSNGSLEWSLGAEVQAVGGPKMNCGAG